MKTLIFSATICLIFSFSCNGVDTGSQGDHDIRNTDDGQECYTSLDCPIGFICVDEICIKSENDDSD